VFHYQEALTTRLPMKLIMRASIGSLALRMVAYAVLPSLPGVPWVVLPLELLGGNTFALYWGAACVQCKRIAPGGLQATMQVQWGWAALCHGASPWQRSRDPHFTGSRVRAYAI
jgi:hypothetical protein